MGISRIKTNDLLVGLSYIDNGVSDIIYFSAENVYITDNNALFHATLKYIQLGLDDFILTSSDIKLILSTFKNNGSFIDMEIINGHLILDDSFYRLLIELSTDQMRYVDSLILNPNDLKKDSFVYTITYTDLELFVKKALELDPKTGTINFNRNDHYSVSIDTSNKNSKTIKGYSNNLVRIHATLFKPLLKNTNLSKFNIYFNKASNTAKVYVFIKEHPNFTAILMPLLYV